ncbi:MAG TPA: hypothetical protein VN873_17710 [Candidatus Angelobacter sp.]|nr:hypothetical protein [Candidatus Angelobacter sp.]
MTQEQQLKLQAFVDGELPESDAREIAAWTARDREATALLGELRHTRQALKGFEPARLVPESREFYWSKIKREIERSAPAPAPAKVSPFRVLRRILVPIGAVAALAIIGIFTVRQLGSGNVHPVQVNAVLADAGAAYTYRDDAQSMTVVWLSYPAEKKLAQSPSADTLPAK